jgi:peptidoglycan-associated lipoprotein
MKQVKLLLFLLLPFSLAAKTDKDLMKANYLYAHAAFHEAIPFYEKVADKMNDAPTYAQLGDCYRLTGDLQGAASAYGRATKIGGCKDEVYLHYGQTLMTQGRYEEARTQFEQYQKNNSNERRIANLIAACSSAPKRINGVPNGIATFEDFNGDGSEIAPTVWKDKLVFCADTAVNVRKKTDFWSGESFYNIYCVSCDKFGHCGKDLEKVTITKKVNIKYHDGPATFSDDGTKMYFTRSNFNDHFFTRSSVPDKKGDVALGIMIATDYDGGKREFRKVTPFPYNNKTYSTAHPTVNSKGTIMVFCSDMPGGAGGSDLYMSTMTDDAKGWSQPVSLGNTLNTEGNELFPYWGDDTTLYFSSDGLEGLGGLDIYVSNYNPQTKTFSAPRNVGVPLNSPYDDESLGLDPEDKKGFFSSNRPGSNKGDNIYFYKEQKTFLRLEITDAATGAPLAATVALSSAKDSRTVSASGNGKAIAQLYPNMPYDINVSMTGYKSQTENISMTDTKGKDTLYKQVMLAAIEKPKSEPVVTDPAVGKRYKINDFYFQFNRYEFSKNQGKQLDTLIALLDKYPNMVVEIGGYTDCKGTDAYNEKLSSERAREVVKYLEGRGIAKKRLQYKGYGSSEPVIPCPVCSECTEEQRKLNRGIEYKVLSM